MALRPSSDLSLGDSFAIRLGPPFKPPSRPKATAAGFFFLPVVVFLGCGIFEWLYCTSKIASRKSVILVYSVKRCVVVINTKLTVGGEIVDRGVQNAVVLLGRIQFQIDYLQRARARFSRKIRMAVPLEQSSNIFRSKSGCLRVSPSPSPPVEGWAW